MEMGARTVVNLLGEVWEVVLDQAVGSSPRCASPCPAPPSKGRNFGLLWPRAIP